MTNPYFGGGGYGGYGAPHEIPSGGAEVGGALANLGQGLQRLIDPNYDLQKQLQQSIALNPSLAQSLSDRAYESGDPTLLNKMIGGKMANFLSQIPPSPVSQQVVQMKHNLGAAGMNDPQMLHKGIMSLPPEMRQMVAQHMGLGDFYGDQDKDVQSQIQQLQLAHGQQQAAVDQASQPGNIAYAQRGAAYQQNPITPDEFTGLMQTIQSGKGEVPQRGLDAMDFDKGVGPLLRDALTASQQRNRDLITQRAADMKLDNSARLYGQNQMSTDLKPYIDRGRLFGSIDGMLDTMDQTDKSGNPTAAAKVANSQLAVALGSLDLMKPQARMAVINYVGQYDKTFAGEFNLWADKKTVGVPNKGVRDGIRGFVDNAAQTDRALYEPRFGAVRAAMESTSPGSGKYINVADPGLIYKKMGTGLAAAKYDKANAQSAPATGVTGTGATGNGTQPDLLTADWTAWSKPGQSPK
jgi:hypothetical protein